MAIQSNFPALRPSMSMDFANSKVLDSRVTFTRASEGRFYDGKTVAKAEENLLTFSQEFNTTTNGWSAPLRASISANATTAPDGTSTADTLIEDATTNTHYVHFANTTWNTGTYTFSVYAKLASGTRRLSFNQSFGGVVGYAIFDLSGGAVAATSGGHTATIASVGDGWYRCSVTYTTSSTTARFDIALNAGGAAGLESYAGNGTSGIHLWGAQLEQRSAVTAYTPTTTQPITNYIPVLQTAAANVARFDHNPVTGESLGLLIEEQRTNLLLRSQEFENASWAKLGTGGSPAVLAAANQAVAPDGTLTADKLIAGTGAGTHYIQQSFAFVASTTYTLSMYVKAGESTVFRPGVFDGAICTFDAASGQFTSVSPGTTTTSTSVGNGWWRISMTATAGGTPPTRVEIYTANNNAGDGFSGIYIWGAQLEAGAFPTSYVATSAAQVTRQADAASMTGANFSSWYRADEGAIYSEFSTATPTTARIYQIGDGTVNNRIDALGEANQLTTFVQANNVTQVNGSALGSLNAGVFGKTGIAYKTNDFAWLLNAGAVATDTSGTVPVVNQIGLGRRLDTAAYLNGHIRKLAYYPVRLGNAALQALTTP